ncbi:hypothetical protein TNCV_217041 [Trichonephila clavipes]|nr:hypothetical protein TNCV_217041 [Trichonephila clavipes]
MLAEATTIRALRFSTVATGVYKLFQLAPGKETQDNIYCLKLINKPSYGMEDHFASHMSTEVKHGKKPSIGDNCEHFLALKRKGETKLSLKDPCVILVDFHRRILFSDEAHFWLNGYVKKQNCRIWSEANPQVYVETPLHPEKLTVWCALWAGGILLQKR